MKEKLKYIKNKHKIATAGVKYTNSPHPGVNPSHTKLADRLQPGAKQHKALYNKMQPHSNLYAEVLIKASKFCSGNLHL